MGKSDSKHALKLLYDEKEQLKLIISSLNTGLVIALLLSGASGWNLPNSVDKIAQERVPNFEALNQAAYVDAFKATMGGLIALILGALFVVSFLPKVEVQADAGHH
ncbi:MAG: hypothetical protein WBD61_09900 [Desulfobulbales bacterium]|jgi:hypothetical protein